MNKNQKNQEVAELREMFENAEAVFLTHYRGLTVKSMNELRRSMDAAGSKYRVAKNTLLTIATDGSDYTVINDDLKGPTGIVFVKEDPAAAAKALCDFAKDNEKLEIVAGALGGKTLSAEEITALSKLPSREQMLGMFVGVLQAPVRDFVGTLAAVPRSIVQVLSAIEEKKAA